MQALCFMTNFQYNCTIQFTSSCKQWFIHTLHSTRSFKQWCCIILYTPPAAASNGAVQYYALHQQLKAMVLYKLCTPPAAASNGAVYYYALHQQLQAMVLYNTMHSTSSCKQWCCTILCTPPAAASNGAVKYYALHQQLQTMVLHNLKSELKNQVVFWKLLMVDLWLGTGGGLYLEVHLFVILA